MNNKEIDLSVIITAHKEGLVAHKTMRSVFEALDRVEKAGYAYEIIVHIDDGDKATRDYFNRYKNDKRIRVYENNFKDAGPSRNYAMKKARGRYSGFFDGDDLISDNWFAEAIKELERSEREIIVHPEAVLTFGVGQQNVLTIQKDSLNTDQDTLILLGENRWCSVLVAKTETLKRIPYKIMKRGYGHEDYVFNIEAMEKDILHRVARGTVLFYRRSDKSRLSTGNKNNVTIPYVEAFDFGNIRDIGPLVQINKKKSIKEKGYSAYKKIRNNKVLNYFITPVAKMVLKVIDYESPAVKKKKIPDFVINEWTKMNHIDSQLYPYKSTISQVSFYAPEEQIMVGNILCKIAQKIRGETNFIFIVPWIVRGGADKVLFNYIEALREINPNWRFTVISTLPANNSWAKKLPEYVDFVDFGNLTVGMPPDLQESVFTRLVVQLKCRRMHIINSEYGYEWVRRHKDLIKYNYNLTVSLFAWEYIKESKLQAVYSYDNPCLFEIFDVVKSVFTDNKAMIDYVVLKNGFDKDKLKVHYQPIIGVEFSEVKNKLINANKIRILWAGRIVPVKLPELVIEIGKQLNSKQYIIDMYGEIDRAVDRDIFSSVENVRYCGAYDGFKSLPTEKYDILLYTSLTDGMPNVILEAAAAGLPIIASNDGGVGEFIKNKKTGILIKNYLDYKPYVESIKFAIKDFGSMHAYADNAQKLLKKQHGWKGFVEIVKRDML